MRGVRQQLAQMVVVRYFQLILYDDVAVVS